MKKSESVNSSSGRMVAKATTTAATPPGAASEHGGRGHEEKVAELAADDAEKVKIKKMLLPEDRLHIAPDEIENEHVAGETEDAGVQKHRAEKLPGVGLVDPAIAQAEILRDDGRLVSLEHLLRDENRELTPISDNRTTRCRGVQRGACDEAFRPDRRIS